VNRRQFLTRGALAGVATALGIGGYTWLVEPHWVSVVQRDMMIRALPASLAGKRLMQISDIHIGPRVDDQYLIDAFAQAAALAPDIVVITGDFLTHSASRGEAQYEQLRRVLAHIPRGSLATVGVLGNHDYGVNWAEAAVARRVMSEAERAGVLMLRNAVTNVAGLDIVGVDDLWARTANPAAALERRASEAAIVLCHNPDTLDTHRWNEYRGWVLSGHTHGGQCKPPFLPPPLLPVRNKRYSAGEIPLADGRRLYINRGLGHLIQVRINARPEITVFTLQGDGATA
jgi:predicted MPP superfamily phosphohydrolase